MAAEKRNVNAGIRMLVKTQYKSDSESEEFHTKQTTEQLMCDELSGTKSKKQVYAI